METEKFNIANAVCEIVGIRFCLVCKILNYELGDTSAVDALISIAQIDEKELKRLRELINNMFFEATKLDEEALEREIYDGTIDINCTIENDMEELVERMISYIKDEKQNQARNMLVNIYLNAHEKQNVETVRKEINHVFDCARELKQKGFLELEKMIAEAARPVENGKPIPELYNGQDYLADCIDSIENQTYKNLEIIIVNDGSTDRTSAVCDSLQTVYHNVRTLTLDDRGVSAARNAGIEAVEGAFVTFVDADDRICPDMIKILYDCMIRTQSDVAGCGFFLWKNEDEWNLSADSRVQGMSASETVVPKSDKQAAEVKPANATGMCAQSSKVSTEQTETYFIRMVH